MPAFDAHGRAATSHTKNCAVSAQTSKALSLAGLRPWSGEENWRSIHVAQSSQHTSSCVFPETVNRQVSRKTGIAKRVQAQDFTFHCPPSYLCCPVVSISQAEHKMISHYSQHVLFMLLLLRTRTLPSHSLASRVVNMMARMRVLLLPAAITTLLDFTGCVFLLLLSTPTVLLLVGIVRDVCLCVLVVHIIICESRVPDIWSCGGNNSQDVGDSGYLRSKQNAKHQTQSTEAEVKRRTQTSVWSVMEKSIKNYTRD